MGLAQEEGPGSAELPVPRGDRQPWPSEVAVPPRAAVQGEALEPDCQFQILEPPPRQPASVLSKKLCNFREPPSCPLRKGDGSSICPTVSARLRRAQHAGRRAVQALGGGCYQHGGKQRGVPQ